MESIPTEDNLVVLIFISLVSILILGLIVIVLFFISRRKIIAEKMHSQSIQIQHKSELIKHNLRIQEEERRRIAQDLHDELGSKLNLISLNIHQIKSGSGVEMINSVLSITNEAIESSRRIAHELLPPALEKFGLIEALEEICFQYNKSGQVRISFETNINLNAGVFSDNESLNLYRVCQELLSNSLKHGKANQINIEISIKENRVLLSYKDNGIGFSQDQSQKGMGLLNIENRIEMIGGEIEFDQKKEDGVEYEIRLKINEED